MPKSSFIVSIIYVLLETVAVWGSAVSLPEGIFDVINIYDVMHMNAFQPLNLNLFLFTPYPPIYTLLKSFLLNVFLLLYVASVVQTGKHAINLMLNPTGGTHWWPTNSSITPTF